MYPPIFSGWLLSIFQPKSYGTAMEEFVASKNPESIAAVEYWQRVFEQEETAKNTVLS